jgi:hypothetical protein
MQQGPAKNAHTPFLAPEIKRAQGRLALKIHRALIGKEEADLSPFFISSQRFRGKPFLLQ